MISIGIIDSHLLLVESLKLIFSTEPDFTCVAEATSYAAGCEMVRAHQMDVLLLEPILNDGDGFQILQHVKGTYPNTITVILTQHLDDTVLLRAINLGVEAFLSKECSLLDLVTNIRRAAAGELILPVSRMANLVRNISTKKSAIIDKKAYLGNLTPREIEVLQCLVMGKSGERISRELNITPLTVRTHIRNIISKLGVHSRLEAVSYAINTGVFTPYH